MQTFEGYVCSRRFFYTRVSVVVNFYIRRIACRCFRTKIDLNKNICNRDIFFYDNFFELVHHPPPSIFHRVFNIYYRSKIELGDVTPHNIKQLKLLNQVVFPVSYNEKFYKDVLEAGELAKLAYYNDIVVFEIFV